MDIEAIQASLNGVWRDAVGGCPHYHGQRDSVGVCDANEMRPCVYETGDGPCETFLEILEEWRIEAEICPECCQPRPGDERVKAGMKCGFCAYTNPYEEALSAGVMPGNLERRKDD